MSDVLYRIWKDIDPFASDEKRRRYQRLLETLSVSLTARPSSREKFFERCESVMPEIFKSAEDRALITYVVGYLDATIAHAEMRYMCDRKYEGKNVVVWSHALDIVWREGSRFSGPTAAGNREVYWGGI